MNISSAVRMLRRSTLFGNLGDERLNVLAFSAERRTFASGDVLMERGHDPAECLVVLKGRVNIRSTGSKRTAYSAGPGGTIGEIALITKSKTDNTVTAVTPGEVIVITRTLFDRMIEDYPDMAVKLRDAMLGRLHRTIGDLRTIEVALRKEPASPERSQNGPSLEHDPMAEASLSPNQES